MTDKPAANLLRPAELAEAWGVSKMTVYRLIETKQLRAFRIGRSIRVREQDATDFLRGSLIGGGAA